MDETISLLIRGCQLARNLESNLPHLANHPNILSNSCDEIVKMFVNASERLHAQDPTSSHPHMLFRELHESQPSMPIHSGVHEWLRSSYTQNMDIVQPQFLAEKSPFNVRGSPEGRLGDMAWQVPVTELGGRDMEGSSRLRRSTTAGESSSSQRPRRRRDEADRRIERVPAPRIGNTEIPPEDGYTWRKYGQKEILGSRFPRGYYRCTHQKLYQCPAKKQVQRLDDDPFTFEVMYRGNHTCHMSSTAPSVAPLAVETAQDQMNLIITTQPPPSTTSFPPSTWLSMEIRPTGEGTTSFTDSSVQMYGNYSLSGARGSSSSMVGGDGAGPSTVRYGPEREADYHPVVDMADVMFNSGSSSTNSMDFIFHSMEDKREPDDKKN